ncbi:MAG: multiprotein-bridging factor 1 family protein [Hyphomicrobiaceae bacterium]
MSPTDRRLPEAVAHAVALRLVEEIARRRMSRRHLADLARISLSTLEKVMAGRRPLTIATLVRLEEALGMSLRIAETAASPSAADPGMVGVPSGVAPDDLGNYARAAVRWIEGAYLTIRPSFGNPAAVYAYCTEIGWDEGAACLRFHEAERTDQAFTQFGVVAVPNQSGHVYLVTNRHGQHRLVTVSRPTITGEMHGILATLKVGRGSQLIPVAAPIVLVPIRAGALPPAFGQIAPGHAAFEAYRAMLKRTTSDEFAAVIDG